VSSRVFLCFDHGEKRTGVAVGQSVSSTATPLETLKCVRGSPDWDAVSKLIKDWRPSDFIVGLPLTMQGERQPATDAAERFARQLKGRHPLPLHFADERLSSHEAKNRLQDTYNLDAHAAQLILESWIAEQARGDGDVTI
jgi:putative holliday junction resolvase